MNGCNIVRDLMPLYEEGLLSDDSLELIRRHADTCPQCRNIWDHRDLELPGLQAPDPISEKKIIKKARKDGYRFDDGEGISAKLYTIADSVGTADEASRQELACDLVFLASVLAGDSADLEKSLGERIDEFIECYPEKGE